MLAKVVFASLASYAASARWKRSASVNLSAVPQGNLDDFGLDVSLWEGQDEPDATYPQAQKPTTLVNNSGKSEGGAPAVVLLGLFNTGTNLMEKLLRKNFPGPRDYRGGHSIWKHGKPAHIKRELAWRGKAGALKDAVTVAVVRDPLSWTQSMRKAPYDLGNCMKREDWPSTPCLFPAPQTHPSTIWTSATVSHTSSFMVENYESVWNDWTAEYGNLMEMGFGKVVVTSYEEIVLDTEAVLGRVAEAMELPAPQKLKQQMAPAKYHGKPNGRMQALEKLRTKSYLNLYTDEQRYEVCYRFNQTLMHAYQYHDCDTWILATNTSTR